MSSLKRSVREMPENRVWRSMLTRCYNTKRQNYQRYGGRGIIVCDRWRTSFLAFLEDMGPRPSDRHQLDRIDNDGPYSLDNCRWATLEQQQRNKRNNRLITAFGKTKLLCEWVEETGIERKTIISRIERGDSPELALTKDVRVRPPRLVMAFGQTRSVAEWVRRTGLKRNTIYNRLRKGVSPEVALTAPVGTFKPGRPQRVRPR